MPTSSIQSLTQALALLTNREREVKHLLVKGLANKAIAAELGISQRTIETHRSNIFKKLEVRNVVELVNFLIMPTIIPPAPALAEPAGELLPESEDEAEPCVLLSITDLNKTKASN